MSQESTFSLRSVKYKEKVYKSCTLFVNEDLKEVRILSTKNPVFFLNRQVLLLNKQVPLLTMPYDESTTVEIRQGWLRVNNSILLEAREKGDAPRIAELISRPRKEAELKSKRELLAHAEGSMRSFLELREEALGFLYRLRASPRETMLELSSKLGDGEQINDPVETITRSYSEKVAKSSENLNSTLSGIEAQVGKDEANRLYAAIYFIGKLQDALFEDGDPQKMKKNLEALKDFGLELGFKETLFEELDKKSAGAGLLDLFRNTRLMDLSEPQPV